MLITLVGGRSADEQRLDALGEASGFRFRIRRAHCEPLGRGDAAFGAQNEGDALQAFVVHPEDNPTLAPLLLRTIRRAPEFRDVPSLLSLTLDQLASTEWSNEFDDFLVTPYEMAELSRRLRALEWRRSHAVAAEPSSDVNGRQALVVDPVSHEAYVDGTPVPLTGREFALLTYLQARSGEPLSRAELLAKIWGAEYRGGPRTVDVHVRRLRKKLGAAFPLETLRGRGYRLRDERRRRPVRLAPVNNYQTYQ